MPPPDRIPVSNSSDEAGSGISAQPKAVTNLFGTNMFVTLQEAGSREPL
jgi:hypothetical protein